MDENRKKRLVLAIKNKKAKLLLKNGQKGKRNQDEEEDRDNERAMDYNEENGEIRGDIIEEAEEDDRDMAEEPVAVRKKHLLKHFRILQSVDSFYSGGTLHFCKGQRKIYSQRDSTVVRLDLETKQIDFEISHNEEEIANFAVNPKDTHMATFTKNSMLRYIKIEEKKIIHSQKCLGFFASDMVFDKSGALLILGDPRGVIDIYELRTMKVVQQFRAHAAGLLGLKLISSKDKFNIFTYGRDRGIQVYDIKQGEAVQRLERDSTSFTALAVEEEGNMVIASGLDGNIHVWGKDSLEYIGHIPADIVEKYLP